MKAIRTVLDFLSKGNVKYIFGIPAGSVNGLFDELYDMPHITPIIAKHEGAASYMASAYAKQSKELGVCIGCSGPGSTNLLTGAAHAMREKLPILFLTGCVPLRTMGHNASQELDATPLFGPVTKYSVTVESAEDLLQEVIKAVKIALTGVPGPVHVSIPIDIQLQQITPPIIPSFPLQQVIYPERVAINKAVHKLVEQSKGIVFLGQGAKDAIPEATELAEYLRWPIVCTPQAKGYIPDTHALFKGVYGFAGHESASHVIEDPTYSTILIIGSSLGETATSNWNKNLTQDREVIQIDIDPQVFNKSYQSHQTIIGSASITLELMNNELKKLGFKRKYLFKGVQTSSKIEKTGKEASPSILFNTQNTLLSLQKLLPSSTRYTVDIGEFMSYVIHYMPVLDSHTFEINVHFGAMGYGISSAIGMKLAEPSRPIACITGDGCFFMHGMEILTAKEYQLPILFIVMNNARLGMVYHGHNLQYKRSHPRFEQKPIDISEVASSMGIPSLRIESLKDLTPNKINKVLRSDGPSVIEFKLIDNNIPPMGDRVKFLSSFQK
jgi:acetolactate synthase-1/2/3 large subunit